MLRAIHVAAGLALIAGLLPAQAGPELQEARQALAAFKEYEKHKNPRVRELAVVTLGETDHLQVAQKLLKMVRDKDSRVRRAALSGLEKQKSRPAVAHLVKVMWRGGDKELRLVILRAMRKLKPPLAFRPAQDLTQVSDWQLRAAAAALVGCYADRPAEGLGTLLPLLEDKQVLVRLAAVDATRTLGNPEAAFRVGALLKDKDWRVQAAVIKALAVFRQKSSVQQLIDFMKGTKGRLVDDAGKALVTITTTDLPADAARWQKWWDRVKDGYKIPSAAEIKRRKEKRESEGYAKPTRDPRQYHGIKTRSRRMLFVIDVSSSMADDIVLDESRPRTLKDFEARYGESRNKIEITRNELIRMVYELKPYVRFNIVTFDSSARRWQKKLVPASTGNRFKAIKFLDKLTPQALQKAGSRLKGGKSTAGQTNTYEALNTIYQITREDDQEKKRYKTEADTVFLLSDGNPTVGEIVNPQELMEYVGRLNAKAKLVIHTISFGTDNKVFMKAIADITGGQYVAIGR